MNEENESKIIELLAELVDLSKGMHKELREIKVRITEMNK
jgi:hypothetical protein